ncbi:hypothetical protein BSL78_08781 [Apostichopus japonicus]|uniref:Uncharacterized protein n=1 Tax=Stichopus japonicus TaxID=307972 RepID=A0A2G8L229_STIJA|nr:hypothetical protein BSL78_08781 [Apostichopus japonicus]
MLNTTLLNITVQSHFPARYLVNSFHIAAHHTTYLQHHHITPHVIKTNHTTRQQDKYQTTARFRSTSLHNTVKLHHTIFATSQHDVAVHHVTSLHITSLHNTVKLHHTIFATSQHDVAVHHVTSLHITSLHNTVKLHHSRLATSQHNVAVHQVISLHITSLHNTVTLHHTILATSQHNVAVHQVISLHITSLHNTVTLHHTILATSQHNVAVHHVTSLHITTCHYTTPALTTYIMCHHLWEKLLTASYLVAIFTVLNLTGCRAITLCGFSLFDKISVESVRQNLTLKETGEGNFYLELNVSWDRPDYDHDGYEVRLVSRYSKDLQANIGCNATKYTRTMEESFFFQNLTFGYEYSIWVLLFNSTRNESSYNPALIDVNTPDCFTMTQSLAFCSSQPITVASPARELRAECASSSIYGNTTDIVISWLPPVQVNGSIYEFVISVKQESDVAFEQVLYLDVNERSTGRNLSRRFDQIIENLLPNITYDIELSSLVRKDTVAERGQTLREKIFPTVVTEETLVKNNNSVTDLAPVCILMEQPIETDEQYESPKLSLWAVIGSMAGMTSLMVIMCIALIMSKKRSVAVRELNLYGTPMACLS